MEIKKIIGLCMLFVLYLISVNATLESNITNYYTSENISVQVNATQETSIAYHLDDDDLIVSDGLIAYYQAENNANDRTGTYNGTLLGNASFTDSINSSYMNAFYLDGSDSYINLSGNDLIGGIDTVSSSFWFNVDDYITDVQGVIGFGSSSDRQHWCWYDNQAGGSILCQFEQSGGSRSIVSTAFSGDTYHFVANVYNGTHHNLYFDGVLVDTDGLTGNLYSISDPMYLGRVQGFQSFNGSIDEIRIYNKALSTTEIELLYNTSPYKTVYDNPLSNGLIAYYQAEDNTDDRQGLNDGTPNGGLTYTSSVNSSFGEAFEFDGVDDYVDVDESIILWDDSKPFSASVWFYPLENNNYDTLFQFKNGDDLVIIQNDLGRITASIYNGTSYTYTDSSTSFNLNQWNHIAFYYDVTDLKTYVNGVEITGSNTPLSSNPNGFTIGTRTDLNAVTFWNGSIDEVRIYDRALNSTEVTELYQSSPNYLTEATFNINELSDDEYNINFFSQFQSLEQSFIIDTFAPIISNAIGIFEFDYTFKSEGLVCSVDPITGLGTCSFESTWCGDLYIDECYLNLSGEITQLPKYPNTSTIDITSSINGNRSYTIYASDLAGNVNTETGNITINPIQYFRFYDNNASEYLQNYTFGDYESIGDYIEIPLYDLGLGNHNLTFKKNGFVEIDTTINFNLTSAINATYYPNGAFINVSIRELSNGSLIQPDNFTLLYSDDVGTITTYNILNNNTINILNFYGDNATVTLNLVDGNGTILTNRKIISPRQGINISFYIPTGETLYTKSFEVLTSGLVAITNSFTFLYANLKDTDEFVLIQQKETNEVGVVNFDVVPGQYAYTICNFYNGAQKCLNQVIFDTTVTGYQIVHSSSLESTTRNILDFISWSYDEVKTNTSSQISFYYEDRQNNVDAFCLNVSRYINDVENNLGGTCSDSLSGVIVQTYSLTENQYLKYTFSYKKDGEYFPLNQYTSRYEGQAEADLRNTGLLDLIFLIVVFGSAGLLLGFKRFEVYVSAFLGILLLLSILQVFFNESYIEITLWGVLATKWAFFYFVRGD